jgi:hypothetical protein
LSREPGPNSETTPAKPTPQEIKRATVRKAMANLQERMRSGETLRAAEFKLLDAYLEGEGPGALRNVEVGRHDESNGGVQEPDDLLAKTQKQLAEFSGLHENTMTNYKRAGIEPPGSKPWSLKAWFLILRKHGRLSETKPTHKQAQEIRAWAFGNGDAADPNDPAHEPPQGWGEEQSRQTALKTKAARQAEEIELETLKRERIPVEEYRRRWRARAQEVLAAIESFMSLPRDVPDITEPQRVALNAAIRAKIRDIRQRLAPPQKTAGAKPAARKGAAHGRK